MRKNPVRASRGKKRFSDDEEDEVPPLPKLTSAPKRRTQPTKQQQALKTATTAPAAQGRYPNEKKFISYLKCFFVL